MGKLLAAIGRLAIVIWDLFIAFTGMTSDPEIPMSAPYLSYLDLQA